jgi:hypothetical protein
MLSYVRIPLFPFYQGFVQYSYCYYEFYFSIMGIIIYFFIIIHTGSLLP